MQQQFIESAVEALETGNIRDEVEKHNHPDARFIPQKSAEHRVPRTFSKQNVTQKDNPKKKTRKQGRNGEKSTGQEILEDMRNEDIICFQEDEEIVPRGQLLPESVTLVDDNTVATDKGKKSTRGQKGKAAKPVEADGNDADDEMPTTSKHQKQFPVRRMNPPRKRRGRNRKYDEYSDSSTDEKVRNSDMIIMPKGLEAMKLRRNPPVYCEIWGQVKRCEMCRVCFEPKHQQKPNNLIFRFRTYRDIPANDGTGRWFVLHKKGNAYYHVEDLACLMGEPDLKNVKPEDLYIEDALFRRLTEAQKTVLKKCGHWKHLRQSRLDLMKC